MNKPLKPESVRQLLGLLIVAVERLDRNIDRLRSEIRESRLDQKKIDDLALTLSGDVVEIQDAIDETKED